MVNIATLLGQFAGCLADPLREELGYVFFLDTYVATLKDEVDKLDAIQVGIQRRVDAATNNVEVIDPIVEIWLRDVGTIGKAVQEIIQKEAELPIGCFNTWCLSLKLRYTLSRSAKEKTPVIVELQNQGQKFENVSCRTPPKPLILAKSSSTILNSRESMLNDIVKSLHNGEMNMIGICGMGGVGKTTMMENVCKKAKEDNLFDHYARTDVSQNLDLRKIQSDIAEMLGLKVDEHSKEVRAGKLHERLRMKKVLIILDDVWEEFDLQGLGIDLEGDHKRCTVLYTSRIQGLWMDFESRRCELPLDVLPYGEAWIIFKEKVGHFLHEKIELVPIAEDIVRECGGLPLSLVTLACGLRGKSKHTWVDTLSKLKRAQGFQGKVNESLKRSYDHLEDDDAKSLFLLSSLFKEDSKIYVERLIDIAVGLRLFKTVSSVEATRVRVFALLEHLQACYLVSSLECSYKGKNYIKVHDVVRDVAQTIASMERGALIFEHGDQLKRSQEQGNLEHSRWISVITNEITDLPIKLQCPKLELLLISSDNYQNIDSFFEEGMVKLQVVVIRIANCQIIRSSSLLQYLKSLRTLCLRKCWSRDLSAIGNLSSLEILRIKDEFIEELPKEIGELDNLVILDLSGCSRLVKISPNVLSCLSNLEELYIQTEIEWESEGNASLVELGELPKLHTLHIHIEDPRVFSTIPLFPKLKTYSIYIGDVFSISYKVACDRVLAISLTNDVPLDNEFKMFLYNSEWITLDGEFVKDIALDILQEGSRTIVKYLKISFTDLKDFTVASSLFCTLETLKLMFVDSLRQISCSRHAVLVFEELREFQIEDCRAMTNIFQVSSSNEVARRGHRTSPVICGYDTQGEVNATSCKLHFPKLESLDIADMPELTSFCIGIDEIQFSQLRKLILFDLVRVESLISGSSDVEGNSIISLFPHKVSFPSLVEISLQYMVNMKEIWGGKLQAGSFYNLAQLNIHSCNTLPYVFHLTTATYLVHLKNLSIESCKNLKEVIAAENEEKDELEEQYTTNIRLLPGLKTITLQGLPALQTFCHVVDDIEFSELKVVTIIGCPEFKTFAPGYVHTSKLNYVCQERKEEGKLWKGNLNSTIQYIYVDHQNRREDDHAENEEDGNRTEIKEDS